MQAKQKPVDQPSLSDLGVSAEEAKPTQQVTGIEDAPERGAGEIVENESEGAARIAQFLQEAKVI
jgi:electron transfer flavoprotein alpha/beta subunit